jgi:hypothetical protein
VEERGSNNGIPGPRVLSELVAFDAKRYPLWCNAQEKRQ